MEANIHYRQNEQEELLIHVSQKNTTKIEFSRR